MLLSIPPLWPKTQNCGHSPDISYTWTAQGWLYLAVMLDLYSWRVIGWAAGARMTSDLPLKALNRAIGPRPRSNAPSQSLPRTEQAPHAVPSPVGLANTTCSVQTDPTAVCVPS